MAQYDHNRFVLDLANILLGDSSIGKIDFKIGKTGRIHVDGKQLRDIGADILAKRIEIKIDDERLTKKNAGAEYQHGHNRINLRSDWVRDPNDDSSSKYVLSPDALNPDPGVFRDSKRNRAIFVHESTHALLDKRRLDVLNVRNEAAAWLAGAVYARHAGGLSELLGDQIFQADPLWKVTDEVARQYGLYTSAGVTLRRKELLPLLKMINKYYDYLPGSRALLDGIDDD